MTRPHRSGPAVALFVTASVVGAVVRAGLWVGRYLLVPLALLVWRLARRQWVDLGRRRALAKGRRQFRLSRRIRRRIGRGDYTHVDPQLPMMSLWWCLWVMAHEVPAVRIAERMHSTDRTFTDAVGFVVAQIYTIPTRHPLEINAAVWAHELRALHGIDRPLPEIDR